MLKETNAFVTIFEKYYFHAYFKRMIEESMAIIQLNSFTFPKSCFNLSQALKLYTS
jgi:hypothetical protein